MLQLKPITKENWIDAIELKVAENQKNFVASNAVSLAQLNFLENFHANGIYDDDSMIGFTLFGIDDEDQQYWIYRLMIDEKYQGKGYGKEAVHLIMEAIRTMKELNHQVINISYEPDNALARYVYQQAGFIEVEGKIVDGEQFAQYKFV